MPFLGESFALGAAMLWSFSSFLFTSASIRIGSLQLNINRMIFAALFLAVTMWAAGISFDITFNQGLYLTLSGLVGLVLGDTFLFRSFKEVGPRIGMLIMSFNPAIAAVMAYFVINENLSLPGVTGIAVTLLGITIVVLERQPAGNKFPLTKMGVLFGFLAAAGQGSGLVFAKMAFLENDISGITATFYRIASAVIILTPLAALAKRYGNPVKLFLKDHKALWMVLLASIIGPYLGIFFSFEAIRHTKVGIASTLMATMPIIMLPLSYIIYKEKLSLKSIAGAFIAVTGVAVLVFFK